MGQGVLEGDGSPGKGQGSWTVHLQGSYGTLAQSPYLTTPVPALYPLAGQIDRGRPQLTWPAAREPHYGTLFIPQIWKFDPTYSN